MGSPANEIDPWRDATWEGAEAAALAVGARMTLAERLHWLEVTARAARALAPAAAQSPANAEAPEQPRSAAARHAADDSSTTS